MTFAVTLDEGQLSGAPVGQARSRLYAAARDTLFPRATNATLIISRDTDGRVTGLVLRQGGQDLTLRKVQ